MGRPARTTRRGVQKDDDGVGGGYYITYSDHVVPLATHACTCMCAARADLLPSDSAVWHLSRICERASPWKYTPLELYYHRTGIIGKLISVLTVMTTL